MSLLVIYEILRPFLSTLTANDKYSYCNSETLGQAMQMQLYKKKLFLDFLLHF